MRFLQAIVNGLVAAVVLLFGMLAAVVLAMGAIWLLVARQLQPQRKVSMPPRNVARGRSTRDGDAIEVSVTEVSDGPAAR
ncbi:MAG: hypothetical protein ABIR80_18160 [Opitutaceae bacterium]